MLQKYLMLDHGGVLDGEAKESSQLLNDDLKIAEILPGELFQVLPKGLDTIKLLNTLVDRYGYQIVFHSKNKAEDQLKVLKDLRNACAEKGVQFPKVTAMAVRDPELYHGYSATNPLISQIQSEGIDIMVAGYDIEQDGKACVREALSKLLGIAHENKELRSKSIVVDDGSSIIDKATEEGWQAYLVSKDYPLKTILNNIYQREQEQEVKTATDTTTIPLNDIPPQTTPILSLLTSISNFFKQMYSLAKYVFSLAWLFSNNKPTKSDNGSNATNDAKPTIIKKSKVKSLFTNYTRLEKKLEETLKDYWEILKVKVGFLDADEYLGRKYMKEIIGEFVLLNNLPENKLMRASKQYQEEKLKYFNNMKLKASEEAAKNGKGKDYWEKVISFSEKAIEILNAEVSIFDDTDRMGCTTEEKDKSLCTNYIHQVGTSFIGLLFSSDNKSINEGKKYAMEVGDKLEKLKKLEGKWKNDGFAVDERLKESWKEDKIYFESMHRVAIDKAKMQDKSEIWWFTVIKLSKDAISILSNILGEDGEKDHKPPTQFPTVDVLKLNSAARNQLHY